MITSLNQLPNYTFKLESQIYLLGNLIMANSLTYNEYLKYEICTSSLIQKY